MFRNILHQQNRVLIVIILLTVLLRSYNLDVRFPFSWDQARDAEMMWQIIQEHRLTLIGPQVVSDDAFFLGPLWYYLLVPFYFVFNMDPLGAAVFVVVNTIITTIALYFLLKKMFGIKEAIIASLIWATIPEVVAWNPILIPPLVIATLWSLTEIIDGKKGFIILSFLLLGIGLQIHFQAIFLTIPLTLSLYTYYKIKKKLPIRELAYGVGLLFVTFLPLLVFDLRHNFINFYGFLKLFGIGIPNDHNQTTYLVQMINAVPKFISTATFFLPSLVNYRLIFGIIVLICSLVGIYKMNMLWSKKSLFLSMIIFPVILFSFYKGSLSEYYFALSSIPILLGLVYFFRTVFNFSVVGRLIASVLLIVIIIINVESFLTINDLTSLYYQKQAVRYLKQQKEDLLINVSFDVPVNDDSGFKYLFKYYGLYPQNKPEGHLWTILIPAHRESIEPREIFGNIGIIRR